MTASFNLNFSGMSVANRFSAQQKLKERYGSIIVQIISGMMIPQRGDKAVTVQEGHLPLMETMVIEAHVLKMIGS